MEARPRKRLLLFVVLALLCFAGDRLTKAYAVEHLIGEPAFEVLAGTVRIQYAENTGAFLGLGADWSDAARLWVFTLGTAAVLIGVGVALVRHWDMERMRFVAAVLVLAGGAGNLVDRVRDGYVVDFVNMGIGSLRTGIFNVADVAITLGVVLLVLPSREPVPEPDSVNAADASG